MSELERLIEKVIGRAERGEEHGITIPSDLDAVCLARAARILIRPYRSCLYPVEPCSEEARCRACEDNDLMSRAEFAVLTEQSK